MTQLTPVTGEGERILEAVRQVRRLHEDISLLLSTADTAMSEHGWNNAKNDSTALYDMSWGIDKPRQWMPWEVFRFYRNDDRRTILASISVLLDDGERRIAEPLVSGAVFELGDDLPRVKYPNWIGGIYKATLGNEADGQFFEIPRQRLEKGWEFDYESAWCFAYPLVEVSSEEFLRKEIVEKLLSRLGALAS